MVNKVIINLDEYLELRERAKKIENLKGIAVVEESDDCVLTPFDPYGKRDSVRKISISKSNLDAFINDIFGVKDFEVNIVEEKYDRES